MYRIMFLESPKSWILKHNCPPGSQVRVCGARPYIFAWEAFVILCVCVYAVTFKRRTKHLSHLSKPDWHTINYFWPLRNELWKALIHSYASRQSTGSALQGAAYQGVNQTWNAAHGSILKLENDRFLDGTVFNKTSTFQSSSPLALLEPMGCTNYWDGFMFHYAKEHLLFVWI